MEYLISAVLVTLLTAVGLYLRWLKKNDDYFEKCGIPYDPRVNFITFLWRFRSQGIHNILLEAYKKHGRLYGGFEFRTPVFSVCEPDLLRDILVKDFHIFNNRRDLDVGDTISSKMVLLLKGEDWKRVRTIITPAFTSKRMRQMSHIINECSQTAIDTLGKYADKREPANVKSILGAFTMDVIASAAFATKIDSHNDPENIFVKRVKDSFAPPSIFQLLAFFVFPKWVAKIVKLPLFPSSEFFKSVILKVVKERRETGKKYNDVLQLLLEAQEAAENSNDSVKSEEDEADQFGSITDNRMTYEQKYKKLSEDELVAQCVFFFIAGYETTASTLSFMAYSFALNPECQEKLIAEVDDAFEKHKEFNYDVVRDMKYLDCVLSETLRVYPALVRSERTASEDYVLGNTGITIEKGTVVGFNIHAMHHDPEFFPNPEKFDPERFLAQNANHPQYAYLPFGAGPRNCLGMRFAIMEIKLCVCNVLQHYRFKKAETTKIPLEFKNAQGLLIVNELPLMIERRTKSE